MKTTVHTFKTASLSRSIFKVYTTSFDA